MRKYYRTKMYPTKEYSREGYFLPFLEEREKTIIQCGDVDSMMRYSERRVGIEFHIYPLLTIVTHLDMETHNRMHYVPELDCMITDEFWLLYVDLCKRVTSLDFEQIPDIRSEPNAVDFLSELETITL